jgi:hypothetical protein
VIVNQSQFEISLCQEGCSKGQMMASVDLQTVPSDGRLPFYWQDAKKARLI